MASVYLVSWGPIYDLVFKNAARAVLESTVSGRSRAVTEPPHRGVENRSAIDFPNLETTVSVFLRLGGEEMRKGQPGPRGSRVMEGSDENGQSQANVR